MKFIVLLSLLTTAKSIDNRANIFNLCLSAVKCSKINLLQDRFDSFENVTFNMKKNNGENRMWRMNQEIDLEESDFDRVKATKVLIHGYRGSEVNKLIGQAYLKHHNFNVIKGEQL